jgi:hypothetical protein
MVSGWKKKKNKYATLVPYSNIYCNNVGQKSDVAILVLQFLHQPIGLGGVDVVRVDTDH